MQRKGFSVILAAAVCLVVLMMCGGMWYAVLLLVRFLLITLGSAGQYAE